MDLRERADNIIRLAAVQVSPDTVVAACGRFRRATGRSASRRPQHRYHSRIESTRPAVTTAAGCATPADGFAVLLFGPGEFAGGVPMLEPTGAGFSTTVPITVRLRRTLVDVAAALGTPLAGTYRLALVCQDRAANRASGMFVETLYLTSPTTYQTTPPPPLTTTSPPGAAHAGRGPGHGLSFTGAAVGGLFLAGLLLAGAGIAFVLISRRRTGPTIHLKES